ncbi:MAG: hypothetical protein U9N61_02255 [Euryarchaeota archaeon]|nr:hypothetical protein [Euryarchaeota archaeon]
MKQPSDSEIKTEKLNGKAVKAIQAVQNYLEIEKGFEADYSDIIVASLKLAQRMGPGIYGIYRELQEEGGNKDDNKIVL